MGRDLSAERAHLRQFVSHRGGRAYANVAVSGSGFGWDPEAPIHHVDAVWIDTGGAGQVVDWDKSLQPEFAALLADNPAVLVSPRGYADRTAFGMLIACRELLSRAYPEHQLLRAIALSYKMSRRSVVYLAEGIDVVQPDGSPPDKAGNRGPVLRGKPEASSPEDALVLRYYNETLERSGTLLQEVPVSDAALDGLYIDERAGTIEWWTGEEPLARLLAAFKVEVIEAKQTMNMDVIGQTIAGAIVLAHEHPTHRLISQTVVVGGRPDPCLDWVCNKRGIAVIRFTSI